MSLTRNRKVRCDWCGRISGNESGYYRRTDGSAGYMKIPDCDRENDTGRDICTDCEDRMNNEHNHDK